MCVCPLPHHCTVLSRSSTLLYTDHFLNSSSLRPPVSLLFIERWLAILVVLPVILTQTSTIPREDFFFSSTKIVCHYSGEGKGGGEVKGEGGGGRKKGRFMERVGVVKVVSVVEVVVGVEDVSVLKV